METLTMSRKERDRLTIMAGVTEQELTLAAAGELMGVCYRQSKRVWRRYQAEGDAGLVHRLRGKPSARRKPPALKARVLALYDEERYADFGPTLMAEHLARQVLMVMVDDATNRVRARFSEQETTRASYDVLEGWARRHRLPRSLYVDRDSIYRCEGLPSLAE